MPTEAAAASEDAAASASVASLSPTLPSLFDEWKNDDGNCVQLGLFAIDPLSIHQLNVNTSSSQINTALGPAIPNNAQSDNSNNAKPIVSPPILTLRAAPPVATSSSFSASDAAAISRPDPVDEVSRLESDMARVFASHRAAPALRRQLEDARAEAITAQMQLRRMEEQARAKHAADTALHAAEAAEHAAALRVAHQQVSTRDAQLKQLTASMRAAECRSREELDQLTATHFAEVQRLQKRHESATKDLRESLQLKCGVCMDRRPSVLYLPCRHVFCCETCDGDLVARKCPKCNGAIAQTIGGFIEAE